MQKDPPLYKILCNDIVHKIYNGEYQPGEKLPSERMLSATYEISRVTVRQALAELEKNGYLYRVHGNGTFVSKPKINTQLSSSFYSFSTEVERLGYTNRNIVNDFHLERCSETVQDQLQLGDNATVFCINRTRFCDNEPFAAETSYIPSSFCPSLNKEVIEEVGLYNALKELAGITMNAASESVEAVLPPTYIQKILPVKSTTPMLKIIRVARSDDHLIEYCECYIRGDMYKYTVFLT